MAASPAACESPSLAQPLLPRPQTLLALVRAVTLATFAATGPAIPSRVLGSAALYVVGACVLGNLRHKWRELDIVLLVLTVSADIVWCAAAFLYFGPLNTVPLVMYAALIAGVVATMSDMASIAVGVCSALAYYLTAYYAHRALPGLGASGQLAFFQAAFIALTGVLCGAVAGQWRRLKRARHTAECLKRLNEETGQSAVSRGRTAVLQTAADNACRIFDAPRAWVMRPDRETRALVLVAGAGLELPERQEALAREPQGVAWHVLQTGQSVLVDPRGKTHPELSALETRFSLGQLMAVAITEEEATAGVLLVSRAAEAESFCEEDLAVLTLLGHAVGSTLRTAGLIRDLHRSSTTDSLTGLYNHGCFLARLAEHVQRAREAAEELSLIVLDMDGFKHINDTAGHWEGNRVLQALAEALRRECREGDTVARCGGDEFAVLLPRTGPEQAAQIAERAAHALQQATVRPGVRTPISASWGIASYPWDSSTDEALFRRADDRLYEAKQAGGNHLAFDPIVLGAEGNGSCVRRVGECPPREELPA